MELFGSNKTKSHHWAGTSTGFGIAHFVANEYYAHLSSNNIEQKLQELKKCLTIVNLS
jgi:hypothetical protein